MTLPISTTTGLESLAQQFRTTTENLANAATPGFKRRLMTYETDSKQAPGAIIGKAAVDFTQGRLVRTGRGLDMALHGDGFFVVETPDAPGGQLYTRCGVFRTNERRQLVDGAGRLVAGTGGPIVLPSSVGVSHVSVARDGRLSAGGQTIGQLRLVRFENPAQLEAVGAACFAAPEDLRPVAASDVAVQGGFQESSNVSTVTELTNLIQVTRLYEANMKSISKQDERMGQILQVAMA
ncbi:MAG: flagellar hook basal-body protein [Phycisphaerae bacterium]|nr:flagellar hook basal-body protein [Phycisphaerae bacterium]